jgi:ubiquitin thioesterase protein OTUB1
MEGINADTKLESLTDAQRLELAEKVRAESTAGQPLISSVEPIEVLEHEYANNDAFLGKIQWLKEAGFIGIRRAKGDGDCFYRAFAFAFIYKLMTMNDRPMHHFTVKHVDSTLQLLKDAGYDESVYTDFYEPLRNLLNRMYSTDPETKELNEHALVEAMNDAEQSNSIVVYLRLLTSAFLKLNADEYTPFLFSLDTHTDAAAPDMQSFCANHVEAIGKEADHVQITALSRALKVSLDVAYLSPAQAPPATPLDEDFPAEQIQSSEHNAQSSNSIPVPGNEAASRRHAADNPNRCDVVRFEVEGGQITEIGTMLLRPGHYDLLVQAPTPASPEPEIPAILST